MKRHQIIQILQFLAVWVFIWLFVVFGLKLSFIDVVLDYRLYFLIVSVSYFYYYSIKYEEDKKYNFVRNVIIYGNLYISAHVFFRPLLNISHGLFVLLWLIILWLRWTTKIKSKWRILLQILWWIFSFFILISGVFYLYPEEPDINWFIQSRKYQLFIDWIDKSVDKSDAYLQISNIRRDNQYQIEPHFTKILAEDCRIIYPSLKKNRDEKIMILTPNGEVVTLLPQSEIQVIFSWSEMINIKQIRWKIWFLSGMFSSSLQIDGEIYDLTSNQLEFVQNLYKRYQLDLFDYLNNQISDSKISLANNTVMYNIDWIVIKFLARMFPASFSRNLRNYNLFQYYFSLVRDEEINLIRYNTYTNGWFSNSSIWKIFRDNIKFWQKYL